MSGGTLEYLRVQVDVVGLHAGFVSWSVRVPSVYLELLHSGLSCWSRGCLGEADRLTGNGITLAFVLNNVTFKYVYSSPLNISGSTGI